LSAANAAGIDLAGRIKGAKAAETSLRSKIRGLKKLFDSIKDEETESQACAGNQPVWIS
jgi:hypothetical protein